MKKLLVFVLLCAVAMQLDGAACRNRYTEQDLARPIPNYVDTTVNPAALPRLAYMSARPQLALTVENATAQLSSASELDRKCAQGWAMIAAQTDDEIRNRLEEKMHYCRKDLSIDRLFRLYKICYSFDYAGLIGWMLEDAGANFEDFDTVMMFAYPAVMSCFRSCANGQSQDFKDRLLDDFVERIVAASNDDYTQDGEQALIAAINTSSFFELLDLRYFLTAVNSFLAGISDEFMLSAALMRVKCTITAYDGCPVVADGILTEMPTSYSKSHTFSFINKIADVVHVKKNSATRDLLNRINEAIDAREKKMATSIVASEFTPSKFVPRDRSVFRSIVYTWQYNQSNKAKKMAVLKKVLPPKNNRKALIQAARIEKQADPIISVPKRPRTDSTDSNGDCSVHQAQVRRIAGSGE